MRWLAFIIIIIIIILVVIIIIIINHHNHSISSKLLSTIYICTFLSFFGMSRLPILVATLPVLGGWVWTCFWSHLRSLTYITSPFHFAPLRLIYMHVPLFFWNEPPSNLGCHLAPFRATKVGSFSTSLQQVSSGWHLPPSLMSSSSLSLHPTGRRLLPI